MALLRHIARLIPGGAVAAAVAVLLWGPGPIPDQADLVSSIVESYALIGFAAAALLAVAFHRSRVLMMVLAVASVEIATRRGVVPMEAAPMIGAGLAVLLGMGVWGRDRGVTSVRGLAQIFAGMAWIAAWGAAAWLHPYLIPAFGPPGDPASWAESATGVADAFSASALGSLLAVGLAVYRRRGPVERATFWSLAMAVAAAHPELGPPAASLLRLGAALTLGLAVLETSYAMAYRDELTGLPARRSLVRDLEGLTGTYTLAMVDVDHFKKFNDRHGHDVGDQVLRMVASRLARAPGGGRAYRYGGEEFTLLYPGVDRDAAAPHLEAVRASVASARFSLRARGRPVRTAAGKERRGKPGAASASRPKTAEGKKLSVTVSIGMADSITGGDGGPEVVLSKADKALYRAKRAGRDRVSR